MTVGDVGDLTVRDQTDDVIPGNTTVVDALELRYSSSRSDPTLSVDDLVEDVAAVMFEGTKMYSSDWWQMLTPLSAGSDTVRVVFICR